MMDSIECRRFATHLEMYARLIDLRDRDEVRRLRRRRDRMFRASHESLAEACRGLPFSFRAVLHAHRDIHLCNGR